MHEVNIPSDGLDLGSAEFEGLLQRLDPDRECAGEKYEDVRRKLLRFFRWNDCFPGEDLADQTFDRVSRKLGSEQIDDVVSFLWGVAKNIVREFHKRPATINLEALPLDQEPHTGHAELWIIERRVRQRRLQCLRKCVQQMTEHNRELFLSYEYYSCKGSNTLELAQRLGLSVSALQTKAHRLKHKLERCTRKCCENDK